MESMRRTLTCVFWGCLLFHFSTECQVGSEEATPKALQDGVAEPRGRHRLQLLFPLLLRISARLATLVPTALMALLGIIVFVIFSKKAFIVSLFVLFLTLSSKYSGKNDEIYIHKVDSYPEYNDEEHIHYHHHGPPRYKQVYYPPRWERGLGTAAPIIPLHSPGDHSVDKMVTMMEGNSLAGDQNWDAEEWKPSEGQVQLGDD